ncbi:Glycosyl transferase, group 1 [Thermococcus sp. 4557]|uniref:glycosyltransferase n=1 Tax=Thermococcus sp. (strain CGMCC 1.5172 / 4557) TaxID=1042877 RepID=UPI000219EEE1|nr:glycosyltransferase [Thermococcus sp. 4557]AEK73090.1 Glycosyl transferase, group 1 [Thermococcus sp. 4557]
MRILTIAPFYKFFIKDFSGALSKEVESIDVLVHHNRLSELAPYMPLSYFRHVEKFSKKNLVDLTGIPSNVRVHVVSTVYFTPDGRNTKLGDKLAKLFDRYIKRHKIEFDLIHAHFTWPSGYAGVKLAKKYGVPSVITVHENRDWFLEEYNSKNERIYWTWKNADALIRVNRADVQLLKEFNSNVFYVPNGFDPKRLPFMDRKEARSILGLPYGNKVVFSLGNLIERKGFQYLIDAMSIVVRERDDVVCYIGGNGPLKDRLQKQINELGLQKHVQLLGFVSDDELKYWMNAADIFVLPSLSEGNPTVMFEALGVGLPFVGTAVGGVPEIITSKDYGLLCPPKDPKCLAEKILTAIEKYQSRKNIKKYAEQFIWDNIARRIIEVYLELTR